MNIYIFYSNIRTVHNGVLSSAHSMWIRFKLNIDWLIQAKMLAQQIRGDFFSSGENDPTRLKGENSVEQFDFQSKNVSISIEFF